MKAGNTQVTSFTAPAALGQLYLISHRGGNRTSNAREGRVKPMDAPSNLRCPHIMRILARLQRSASSAAASGDWRGSEERVGVQRRRRRDKRR